MSLAEHELLTAPPRRRPEVAPHGPAEPGRRLRLVERPARRRRPRTAYAIVALLGVAAIVAVQIMLSMLTTQGSYAVADLMQQRRDLTLQQQELKDTVAGLSSPQYLAANAADLGMVIDGAPNFLRLSDGKVTGTGKTSSWNSTVDMKNSQVGNALIADTPLATDPQRSIEGNIATERADEADAGTNGDGDRNENKDTSAGSSENSSGSTAPPSIDQGLPSPQTH